MKHDQLKKRTRILLVACGGMLLAVLFVPLWRIDLSAPQYPEGLRLLIYTGRLGGDVAIINGLNHYIGMKTLHTEDFFEFTILPFIIIFFSLLLMSAAVVGKRRIFYAVFLLFVCFGMIAMVDFWRWEYNYGHHLNPDAAIVVPGMAYQPPLIGFKQLLNFGAYSIPAAGGWLFLATGAVLLFLAVMEWKSERKRMHRLRTGGVGIACIGWLLFTASCSTGPRPITAGKDRCDFCKMTVSDNRFGAEIVTKKGKVYKFDDTHCLLSFLRGPGAGQDAKDIYFTDFANGHSLIKATGVYLLKSKELRSPMEGNVAAFASRDSLDAMMREYQGAIVTWNELYR